MFLWAQEGLVTERGEPPQSWTSPKVYFNSFVNILLITPSTIIQGNLRNREIFETLKLMSPTTLRKIRYLAIYSSFREILKIPSTQSTVDLRGLARHVSLNKLHIIMAQGRPRYFKRTWNLEPGYNTTEKSFGLDEILNCTAPVELFAKTFSTDARSEVRLDDSGNPIPKVMLCYLNKAASSRRLRLKSACNLTSHPGKEDSVDPIATK
jgi:hypothetical protein